MTTPSLARLRSRLRGMSRRDRAMIEAYCLIYDASEGAEDAYRKLALAGVRVLMDEMKKTLANPPEVRLTGDVRG